MQTGRLNGWAAGAALAAILTLGSGAYADDGGEKQWPETQDPIKISIINYTGQNVLAYIYGGVLERIGYKVEYVQADYVGQWVGIAEGDIDVGIDMWETTTRDLMREHVQSGKVLNMGTQAGPIWETWWYPTYVEDVCPGLPNWEALKEPACIEALSTAETTPKARLITGPVEWNLRDQERVDALGLEFEVINAGGDAALIAVMTGLIERKEPFMGFIWSPHWFPLKHEGKFVEFPTYEPGCMNDPAWGVNKEMTGDCEMPGGYTWKVAWAGGEVVWPKAYKVLRLFRIDHDTMSALVTRTDIDKLSAKEAAEEWLAANEVVWRDWLK
jgi:glycine betaine/proline transport system substrate-binding protein